MLSPILYQKDPLRNGAKYRLALTIKTRHIFSRKPQVFTRNFYKKTNETRFHFKQTMFILPMINRLKSLLFWTDTYKMEFICFTRK